MNKGLCIIILGMHRSGTSALSGLIHQLGFNFGSSITEPSWDNPRGFYENYKIQYLNDTILKALDRTWDTPGIIDREDLDNSVLGALRLQGKSIIKSDFQGDQLIAIKDPRICLLFPFWQSVLEESGYEVKAIFLLREPSEIEASLSKRNFFSKTKSHLLTASHWLTAEENTRGLQRSFVTYNDLISDPNSVSQVLISELSLLIDAKDRSRDDLIKRTIRTDLRHFKHSDVNQSNEDSFLTSEIYKALLSLSEKGNNEEVYQLLDSCRKQFLEYDKDEIKRLSGEQQYFAKLIFDDGAGYTEAKTRSKLVNKKTKALSFSIDPSKEIHRLVIFPANAPCIIEIKGFYLGFVGEEVSYELSDNSSSLSDNTYIFKGAFPQIILELKQPSKIEHIHFDVAYQKIGKSISEVDSENLSKKDSASVLSVLVKHPLRALKSINLNNYRTLRRAMKRESPQTILRNFVKLLKRPDHQKLITSTSSKNKADLINETAIKEKSESNSYRKKSLNQDEKKLCQVLYIAPALPEHDTSSGGKRATKMLELLNTRSTVSLLSRQTPDKKYATLFKSQGIDVFHLSSRKLKEQLPIIDIIICAWYYTYYEIDDIRLLYPEARVIIDSVDVHWVREERSVGILQDLTLERVKQNKTKEAKAYEGADVIWAVSEEDKKAILKELPDVEVAIVSNIHSFKRSTYIKPDQPNLLFIGGFDHYPNLSAAIRLAKDIFPIVKAQCKDAQLILAGSNASKEILKLDELDGVTFIGWVTTEELEQLYDKTLLSVVPLLTGAGVKGKITEAISYMTPVVTNAIGNEGIHLEHQVSGLLAQSDEDFAQALIKAIREEYSLPDIARKAQQQIKGIISAETALDGMWSSFFRPVDICIVTYNRLGLLQACIESLLKYTIHPNYNIIVYSNGCSDGTKEYLRDIALENNKIRRIISNTNEVFVRPNNKMMQLHGDRDVVLLNNDVEVTEGWLIGLSLIASRSTQVGIVGSKILYPDDSLQEFGSELYEDGTGVNIGKGEDPGLRQYNMTKAVPYVSGCSMYIKRSTIQKIGVFDDAFHPCYCEDSDYCYTAWENGIKTMVTPFSTIYHLEGSTSGTDTTQGFKKYQAINMKKFLAKHKPKMKKTRSEIKKFNKTLIRRPLDIS